MSNITSLNQADLGEVSISPHVIELITKLSSLETEGISELSGSFTGEIAEFLGRNESKGIKVVVEDEKAIIDISVIIEQGYNIPDLAERLQENVKSSIENMTQLVVTDVNVHINGIHFENA